MFVNPIELNVLIRGQSNAVLLGSNAQGVYARTIVRTAQAMLGFDGTTQRINLIFEANDSTATAFNGTSLLRQWLSPANGDWHNGWTASTYENGLLAKLASLSATQRAEPTATIWLHNESDSQSYVAPDLTAAEWASAVRFDAGLVRAALGQTAATTPYLFVDAIPSPTGVPLFLQDIDQGMQTLAADPGFNASIAAYSLDVDMGTAATGSLPYGGAHLNGADLTQLANRLGASVAEAFASYALPGSAVTLAGGDVANTGPQVTGALLSSSRTMVLTLALDHGSALQALDAAAATGLGWSVQTAKGFVTATAASLVDGSLTLTFASDVHLGDTLYYGYGASRLAATDNTGEHHAVYDGNNLPIWTSAYGVTLQAGSTYPQAPLAQVDAYQAMEEQTLTVAAARGVLANDTDPTGLALSTMLVSGPAHGSLTLNADGSFSYTPVALFHGTDSFIYQAQNSANQSPATMVALNVVFVDHAPVAVTDSFGIAAGQTLTVAAGNGLLANDTDAEGNGLTAQLVTAPAKGVLSLAANGSFVYVPNAGTTGTDSFTYRAFDGTLASAPAPSRSPSSRAPGRRCLGPTRSPRWPTPRSRSARRRCSPMTATRMASR